MACIEDSLAFVRARHHVISKNDMNPTPSQPMNRRNRLLAVARVNIASKKISRYWVNLVRCLSVDIYQSEYVTIVRVINRAIGINVVEYVSNFTLRVILNVSDFKMVAMV